MIAKDPDLKTRYECKECGHRFDYESLDTERVPRSYDDPPEYCPFCGKPSKKENT